MQKAQDLETLFERALAAFPHELESTSITQGSFEPYQDNNVEYAEEYTFVAGHLLDDELTGGGWIDLRQDNGDISISAFFGVARNGDWEKGSILPENVAIQAAYDIATNTWEIWIDQM